MSQTLHSFEDLDCYQEARALRRWVSSEARRWPEDERYRLIDQILRSSRSVTANIAEGFGRHHHQENLQFCCQARGSLTESLDHMITAHDEGFTAIQKLDEFRQQYQTAIKLLNGYIGYLTRAASEGHRSSKKD